MNKEIANLIVNHVKNLADRPGLFVGNNYSMREIEVHLEGYFQALFDTNQISERNVWANWIALNYKKWPPKWSWGGAILSSNINETKAIESLASLVDKFVDEVNLKGEIGIINEYSERTNS